MKDRMNVPQEEYDGPALPRTAQEWLMQQREQGQAETDLNIWYQCADHPYYWSTDGHRSYKQPDILKVHVVLSDPANEGALMVGFNNQRYFIIQGGSMRPVMGGQ